MDEGIRDYRTVRGYQINEDAEGLSPAMEDYLEMVARLCRENGCARISEVSAALHVKPSSASKMVSKLHTSGYLSLDRSSNIYMTALGKTMAEYLLYRHETIENFLIAVGSKNALKETELIEHFLSSQTVDAIKKALFVLQENT